MKKTTIIFLAIFYLFVSSGVAMDTHFCGGKLKKISFFEDGEKGCCGSKKKSMGCCKTHSLVYKIKDKHNSFNSLKALQINCKILFIIPFQLIGDYKIINDDNLSLVHSKPPVLYDNPIYLKYKVLII